MSIKYILILLFLSSTVLVGQNSSSNTSNGALQIQDIQQSLTLPPLDLREIYAEDAINDLDKGLPWRYGVERSISLNTATHGVWDTTPDGDLLWIMNIKSLGAKTMSVNFDEIDLPEGSAITIYNGDKTDIGGGFDAANIASTSKPVGTWFVLGEEIIIEYIAPADAPREPIINIGSIIHGYRLGKLTSFDDDRGLNDSGDCQYDVNCFIGEDFEVNKNKIKKAIALLNLGNGFLCTAALVNNTKQDKTPYLLTANHCLEGSNPNLWVARFNWMSPNPVCSTEEDSDAITTNFTMSGATLRASNPSSDFALVELNNSIPSAWDVSFAGWDASEQLPSYSVGIHHPQGDVMKVCRDDTGAVKTNTAGTELWLIGGGSEGVGDGWELGTTEAGSSGSPLLNEEGCIIGVLHGGASFCVDNETNNEYDVYGRFGVAWNQGNSPENRLVEWLDPLNQGTLTLGTLENNLNTVDVELEGALEIYPNPVFDVLTVNNSKYPNLKYFVYDPQGKVIMQGDVSTTMNAISMSQLNNGVYFLLLQDEDSQSNITKKIVVAH